MMHPRKRGYPPQSGIYLTQSLRPPYQVAVLWRGRVIASCWAGSYQRAREEAAALQESLAALKIIDRTDAAEGETEALQEEDERVSSLAQREEREAA